MEERFVAGSTNGTRTTYRIPKSLKIGPFEDGATHRLRFTVDEESTEQEGKKVYRRHKQGSKVPKSLDDDRVTLYALLADEESVTTGGNSTTVAYYFPHAGGVEVPTNVGKVKKSNRQTKLIQIVQQMKSGDTRPVPGKACERCTYHMICSR